MNPLNYHVLAYFNYDSELLLDEFNHYYNIKQQEIPPYYLSIFMYFTHLSELGLQILIKNNYHFKQAQEISGILPAYIKIYTEDEFLYNMQRLKLKPLHYYGLFLYAYYFFEIYIDFLKNGYEKSLNHLSHQLPVIEANIRSLNRLLPSLATKN